jgi:glycosyltransferase involved in cell wall biosynthesis
LVTALGHLMKNDPRIVSTLKFHNWSDRVRTLDLPYRAPAPHRSWREAVRAWRILSASRSAPALLLNSASGRYHPDLIASVLLGFLPKRRRPVVALMGDMWEPSTGLRGLIEKAVVRLADRGIDRYLVYSTEERDLFPGLWKISADKVGVCLCYHHVSDEELSRHEPGNDRHIFAGGDSCRDYAPLVEAARRFPDTTFVLATAWTSPTPLPPNVKIVLKERTKTSHAEFVRLMWTARAVVVPIRQGLHRSIGQQTFLNSMYMGKPTIISKGLGVRDHVVDGEHALVVDGSVDGYVKALGWVLDPQNQLAVIRMADRGRERARIFSPAHTADRLCEEVEALLSPSPKSLPLAAREPSATPANEI